MGKTVAIEIASSDGLSLDDADYVRPAIPDYLEKNYWWAYLNPKSVEFFEHQWVVNLILWGNFSFLRDLALAEMGTEISGRTLQIACVYGDFTPMLARRLAPGARLDVVDIAPIQLTNLREKMGAGPSLHLHHQDAARLRFQDASFDQAVLFFLLNELPAEVRKQALGEALRVIRPGGKLVVVDYHRPGPLHPHRYLMPPIFMTLEPFALDLWRREIADWAPVDLTHFKVEKSTFFGGLYQKVVILRPEE